MFALVDPADVELDDAVRVDFGPADRAAVDGTGGSLDLAASPVDVLSLSLVDLPDQIDEAFGEMGWSAW